MPPPFIMLELKRTINFRLMQIKSMSNAEHSILRTIVYYDCLNFPLTSFEVYEYLTKNPEEKGPKKIDYGQVCSALFLNSALKNFIEEKNGFYFLNGRSYLVEQRIEREKISSKKWKKLRHAAVLLQAVPFLRLIFVSGSLAQNSCHSESDLDLLIVAKSGRIWTARFFATILTHVLGLRRHGEKIKDRVCLNHYITDKSLQIPQAGRSLYTAQIYNQLVLLFEKEPNLFSRFREENGWIKNYFQAVSSAKRNGDDLAEMNLKRIKEIRVLLFLARAAEFILKGYLGGRLEMFLRRVQGSKIRKNPMTHQSSAGIFVSDDRLRFHPESPESAVLDKYKETMIKFGLSELGRV